MNIYFAHKLGDDVGHIAGFLLNRTPGIDFLIPENFTPNIEDLKDRAFTLSRFIFETNVRLIDRCEVVLAKVDKYDDGRDSGVMWEIGYAYGKDIPVITFCEKDSESNRNIMIESSSYKHFNSIEELISQWVSLIHILKQ